MIKKIKIWRQGTKIKLNIYRKNKPMFQAHSAADAKRIVRLLNIGETFVKYLRYFKFEKCQNPSKK